jgi:hypothetical protein
MAFVLVFCAVRPPAMTIWLPLPGKTAILLSGAASDQVSSPDSAAAKVGGAAGGALA